MMGMCPVPATDPKDAEIARLKAELKRFKEENQKVVRQLNAERKHNEDLERENARLEREYIAAAAPDARAHLQSMLDDLS